MEYKVDPEALVLLVKYLDTHKGNILMSQKGCWVFSVNTYTDFLVQKLKEGIPESRLYYYYDALHRPYYRWYLGKREAVLNLIKLLIPLLQYPDRQAQFEATVEMLEGAVNYVKPFETRIRDNPSPLTILRCRRSQTVEAMAKLMHFNKFDMVKIENGHPFGGKWTLRLTQLGGVQLVRDMKAWKAGEWKFEKHPHWFFDELLVECGANITYLEIPQQRIEALLCGTPPTEYELEYFGCFVKLTQAEMASRWEADWRRHHLPSY